MKKLLVLLVVLAITMISSMAFAASEVTLSGTIEVRGRAFNNTDNTDDVPDYNRDTQSRIRINVDAKAGDAKAKVTFERDYETWGGIEQVNGPLSALREAWLDTPLLGGVRLKAGHMLLQLSNGWFLRNMKYGDDAWVAYTDIDNLHLGLVDAKIAEAAKDNDSDFYAAVATMKMGDMTVGANLSRAVISKPSAAAGSNVLNNLGLHAAMKAGALNLMGELDLQMGTDKTDCVAGPFGPVCGADYKGNQLVIQGTMAMDPVTVNFTLARGSGNETPDPAIPVTAPADNEQIVPVLDADPHYTFLYEYKMITAAGATSTGFANTTALSAGADAKLGSLSVGGNIWLLMATEDVALRGATDPITARPVLSDDLGIEIDARIGWKISDNVSWNWTLGYFMPGDAYQRNDAITGLLKDADETTGVQGVLTMKF